MSGTRLVRSGSRQRQRMKWWWWNIHERHGIHNVCSAACVSQWQPSLRFCIWAKAGIFWGGAGKWVVLVLCFHIFQPSYTKRGRVDSYDAHLQHVLKNILFTTINHCADYYISDLFTYARVNQSWDLIPKRFTPPIHNKVLGSVFFLVVPFVTFVYTRRSATINPRLQIAVDCEPRVCWEEKSTKTFVITFVL